MGAKKFYAVKIGHKPGVYKRWEDAKKQVFNYSGAVYRGFDNFEAAWQFLESETPTDLENHYTNLTPTKTRHLNNNQYATVYTDGSYDEATKSYSYGVVILWKKKMIQISRRFNDPQKASLRNVAGELEGAHRALQFALTNKIRYLTLWYDYEGIAAWAQGTWQANTDLTKAYRDFACAVQKEIQLTFKWVKGHSGNYYNEMVDQLAKTATFEEYRQVEEI